MPLNKVVVFFQNQNAHTEIGLTSSISVYISSICNLLIRYFRPDLRRYFHPLFRRIVLVATVDASTGIHLPS